MSLQGPLVVVAEHAPAGLQDKLVAEGAFPVVVTSADRVADAIIAARPSAIILADPHAATDERIAVLLSETVTGCIPIVPVIACAPADRRIPYREALPVSAESSSDIIAARLSSAMRVRQLHDAVLRRAELAGSNGQRLPSPPDNDPLDEATIIVAGRGRDYPDIATAIAGRAGLIGALSIEIAARYLKSRNADGLVIADGFNPWNVNALLIVLAEDSRFRDMPIGLLGHPSPQLEFGQLHVIHATEPEQLVARLLPLARLHAFEARLQRVMDSFDRDGVIDPATGLHFAEAFHRTLESALHAAGERGTGLCLARFGFDGNARMKSDAARLISKLIRKSDFAGQEHDGAVLLAFADTDLKHAHVVARRIASVLKHTMLAPGQSRGPIAPDVTLAARKPGDNAASLIARVSPSVVAAE